MIVEGSRVKITAAFGFESITGLQGTVVKVNPRVPYPYTVKLDCENYSAPYLENELEIVS